LFSRIQNLAPNLKFYFNFGRAALHGANLAAGCGAMTRRAAADIPAAE